MQVEKTASQERVALGDRHSDIAPTMHLSSLPSRLAQHFLQVLLEINDPIFIPDSESPYHLVKELDLLHRHC